MDVMEILYHGELNRFDLDDIVAATAIGEAIQAKYTASKLEQPEGLTDRIETLNKEIKARRRDNLELALKQAQHRRANLATAEEKRTKADEDITRIQSELQNV